MNKEVKELKLKSFFGESIRFDYIYKNEIYIKYDVFEDEVYKGKWFALPLRRFKSVPKKFLEESIFIRIKLDFLRENYIKFKINEKIYYKDELINKLSEVIDEIIEEIIEENKKNLTN